MLTAVIKPSPTAQRFVGLSLEDRDLIITSGMDIFDARNRGIASLDSSEWSAKLNDAQAHHKLAMHELQTSQERQANAHKQEIEHLQTLHKAAVTRALQDEEHRRLEAERVCASQAGELREIGKTMFIQIKSECDAIRQEYDERLRIAETRERDAQDTLSSMVVRRTKSTAKGVDGEARVCQLLNQLFPTADVEDCRHSPGLGDFVVLQGDVCMMVEVKNYKRNVAKAEVDKFMRDMNGNPGYTCGIIASLNSGISGWKDFSLGTSTGRPVIFLHDLEQDPDKLKHAFSVFELVHSVENLDLGKQSTLEAVRREIADKERRSKQLHAIASKHLSDIETWMQTDDQRSLAVLRLIAEL
jgi:hypothetical protein